jgi:hypothetical protein
MLPSFLCGDVIMEIDGTPDSIVFHGPLAVKMGIVLTR